jgi:low temperature requirement protein LtrA
MADARPQHRTLRMTGRDPGEAHRTATPLELLFDLTFVIAFGTAAAELAHGIAEGHVGAAVSAFLFAAFAVSWAWINFTWFASAYDNDDWLYRLTTMLQMAGALVFALGLPAMFASFYRGVAVDNDVMVIGYVVMRVAMVLHWWRASRHDPGRRPALRVYLVSIVAAQVMWCVIALLDLSIPVTLALMAVPYAVETAGPLIAERRAGGTPWHPHHVAERNGLMMIIALGEGLIGTMAGLTAAARHGLTLDVAVLALAGTVLTFGLWWSYFVIPHGAMLAAWRRRSFVWGYGHIALFATVVATGAGLDAAAFYLEGASHLGLFASVDAVAIPLAVYLFCFYGLYAAFTRTFDPFHLLLVAFSAAIIVAALVLAAAGVPLRWDLALLALTPWVTVLGYETVGHRHNAELLGYEPVP